MNTTSPYLFVYGSLRSGFKNPAYDYLTQYFSFAGEGKVRGVFYEKDNNPVAVPTDEEHFLVGELYKLKNDDEFTWAFEQLDDYEGIHVLVGEIPLYKRSLVEVLQNDHLENAWIYWYNKSVDGLPKIETGDLLVYLQQKTKRSFLMLPLKKIYFLSDFHLGAPDAAASLLRERKIVAFLDSIKQDAAAIFIVGDLFDFGTNIKVVPKGYVRILGKIAEITDAGIPVHFFVGNHDMWMKDYFQKELNTPVYFEPKTFTFNSKRFLIGHGDGLGPGDEGYKFIKKIFRNKICQMLFGAIPPRLGIGLADYFSRKSRAKTGKTNEVFLGEEKEWLVVYSKEILQKEHFDYFIFGHRHLPLDIELNEKSRYVNLGDWIKYFTYAVFDGEQLSLHYHKD